MRRGVNNQNSNLPIYSNSMLGNYVPEHCGKKTITFVVVCGRQRLYTNDGKAG
jgi:hypothetical protein